MAERSLLGCNLMPVESYDFTELEDPIQYYSDHLQMIHPYSDQMSSFVDPNNFKKSDIDELNPAEEGAEGDENAGKRESSWQRVKWTDAMVKLMITAVSYVVEDRHDGFNGGKRKGFQVMKKGKWKSISNVMAKRGFQVSPQQCEDKFNDLNKRYKKLNEILGRGTSCMVVENPRLLDAMNLSENEKEEVRKILSSKQLFYEEMCSYHNGNRLFLPHDPDLQQSLQPKNKELDEEDKDAEKQDGVKRLKRMDLQEDISVGKCFRFMDCNDSMDVNLEDDSPEKLQKPWMAYRVLQLEEGKLHLKSQMLELEKQRLQWQKLSWEHDRDLEKMKLENETMKLVNERIALEIERKKLGYDY